MLLGHGGHVFEIAKRLGIPLEQLIDMSSNTNPLGPPKGLISFLRRHLKEISLFPEVISETLISLLAQSHGIAKENILIGHGSTEFIYIIPRALSAKNVLIVGPTYADYKDAVLLTGGRVEYVIALEENGFAFPLSQIDQALAGKDLVFLCRPNNPTGRLYHKKFVKDLILSFPDIIFVIDESYLPFVTDEEEETFARKIRSNVIVLRSFSKFYTIPGLRLGYVVANEEIIAKIKLQKQPWSVNRLAQRAGEFLLQVKGYKERTWTYLNKEKVHLETNLERLPYLKVFPSEANFLLLKIEREGLTASELKGRLFKRYILIRDCSNFEGLDPQYFRIAIKRRKENRLFIKAMREIWERL